MKEKIAIDVNFNTGRIKFKGDPHKLKEILSAVSEFVNETNINEIKQSTHTSLPNSKQTSKKKASGPKKSKPNSSQVTKSNIDANGLANKIKDDTRFNQINTKVIMVEKDFLNKAKFVIYMSDQPMNSGDVLRTLLALNIKATGSSLSKALSNNRDQFIVHETSPLTYSLSAPTKVSVENWLMNTTEA